MTTLEIADNVVKFSRKPAKMGEDHVFWIPRLYVREGLVDPKAHYTLYLVKQEKKGKEE